MTAGGELRIGGIVDMSTVDWYGNVSLVVFFAGCNFRCPYCQNSGLIPMGAGEIVDLEFIKHRINLNMSPVPQLDSIVFTGGEPTLQPEGLFKVASLVREMGYKVMLDTNGSHPEVIEDLLKDRLIDRVALDVKAPLNSIDYCIASGLRNSDNIIKCVNNTIDLCNEYNVEIEARTTVAPGVSDSDDFIKKLARNIKGRVACHYLQQYDNTGEILDTQLKLKSSPTRERMLELGKIVLEEGVVNVYIKTRSEGLERIV